MCQAIKDYYADKRLATRHHALVEFHLGPSHELGFANVAEAVKLRQGGEEGFPGRIAKLFAEPIGQVLVDGLRCDAIDVPCHVQEEFEVVGRHFRVVHIGYPQLAAVVVVGRFHLAVDEAGLRGGEPKIVVGAAPIAEVVVDSAAATALLFPCIRQTGHVAVVVVAPHQRHMVGHLQALFIQLKHFLVGNEYQHLLRWVADMLAK